MDPGELSEELLIRAYAAGIFPMARWADGPIDWYSPDPRAIMPIETFHVRRSLAKRVRNGPFMVTFDRAFARVIRACAEPRRDSEGVWISQAIIDAYTKLHEAGLAHSVEAWVRAGDDPDGQDDELVGGLYGVALGGAFLGESMFSRVADASQVCLVKLVAHLRRRGYVLLDVQFSNPHLEQFGVVEISREGYMERLKAALEAAVRWE